MVQTFMKSLLVGTQMVLAERVPPSAAWRSPSVVVVNEEVLLLEGRHGREGNLYLEPIIFGQRWFAEIQ